VKNKKGFTLIELLIVISIIGVIVPFALNFIEVNGIAKKAGNIVQEFKQEASTEKIKIIAKINPTVTDTVQSDVECFEGKKIIHVNGEMYHIGKIDSWGDVKSIDCNVGG